MRLTLTLCLVCLVCSCAAPGQNQLLPVGPGPCGDDAPGQSQLLLVGPGPCGDDFDYGPTGELLRGCVFVLLTEARRTTDSEGTTDSGAISVSGRVLAAGTLEPLERANVRVLDSNRGVATEPGGWFELSGLSASDRLVINFVGAWADTLVVRSIPGPPVQWPER